jgi:hypothetical protein
LLWKRHQKWWEIVFFLWIKVFAFILYPLLHLDLNHHFPSVSLLVFFKNELCGRSHSHPSNVSIILLAKVSKILED